MNIAEIIAAVREDILDDLVLPYLWSNAALIRCLNRAYNELANDSWCIIDNETVAVCRVPLYANQTLHALHAKIVNVFDAIRESDGYRLPKKTEAFMSGFTNWKVSVGTPYIIVMDSSNRKFSAYPKFNTDGYTLGVSDISFTATSPAKTITKTGTSPLFSTYFTAGKSFLISGVVSNNGVFTVASSTPTTIVVNETIVDEPNTSAKLQLERDAALLRVARLPLVPYVPNDLSLATPPTPEIDAVDHDGLLHGISKYAYLKPEKFGNI